VFPALILVVTAFLGSLAPWMWCNQSGSARRLESAATWRRATRVLLPNSPARLPTKRRAGLGHERIQHRGSSKRRARLSEMKCKVHSLPPCAAGFESFPLRVGVLDLVESTAWPGASFWREALVGERQGSAAGSARQSPRQNDAPPREEDESVTGATPEHQEGVQIGRARCEFCHCSSCLSPLSSARWCLGWGCNRPGSARRVESAVTRQRATRVFALKLARQTQRQNDAPPCAEDESAAVTSHEPQEGCQNRPQRCEFYHLSMRF
jgi:hypothetical protein